MLVHIQDGKVVRVSGDPENPVTRGFLCVKVNHYEERVHSGDRVLHPLKRVGAKGEGRFVRMSWDEALAEVAGRLTDVCQRYGGEAILPYSYAGTMGLLQYGSMDRRFFHKIGASRLLRTICSAAGSMASLATIGAQMGPDPETMVDCKLIVVWGLNMASSNVHGVPLVKEAQRRGAKLVVVDPVKNRTARMADWHIQPRPGTDTALALGLIHVIVREGLQDQDYIDRYTLGWDDLKARAEAWPPERVETVTGVAAADVERFARLYATTRPSLLRAGYGIQRHTNGGTMIRALASLPAVVGAWRDSCGGFLLSNGGYSKPDVRVLERPDLLPDPRPREVNMIELGKALTELHDPPVQALFVYNSNPASVAPNQNKVIQGLLRDDLFTVVHEQLMTDTCRYADIILPATTSVEHMDVYWSYWHLYLQLARPAIEPLGEAIPNTELFRRLAAAMGLEDPCLQDSDEEMIRQSLARGNRFVREITFEELWEKGRVKVNVPAGFQPFAEGFATPSGKVEFYSESLARHGSPGAIDYTPTAESADGSPDLHSRYPLNLLSPGAHHFLNSTFSNLPSMKASERYPTILMNPEDAAARHLADGDWTRTYNDRGEVWLRVQVSDHTKPGVAVSYGLWWNQDSPGGKGVNVLTNDLITDMGKGPAFHSNLVEVEKVPAENVPVAMGRDQVLAGDD